MNASVLLVCMMLALPLPASGEIYVVSSDGTGDFPTIQAAIDAASQGDLIELTDGIFSGDGNRDLSYGGKGITVGSQSGFPANCVVDCGGTEAEPHRGFDFVGEGSDATLQDITIRNGFVAGSLDGYGGAVRCSGESSPRILDCVLAGNGAARSGGGIYCTDQCAPVLEDCTFSNNSTAEGWAGGGLCTSGDCHVILRRCRFSENTASVGGGAHCVGTPQTVEFVSCTFEDNISWSTGGGADVWGSQTDVSFRDCVFTGNEAGSEGGGIRSQFCSPVLEGVRLNGNSAEKGGGLFSGESEPVVSSCSFEDNVALRGGAVFAFASDIALDWCTFRGNSGALGGALWFGGSNYCWPSVANCTLVCNSATGEAAGAYIFGQHCEALFSSTIIAFSEQGSAVHCEDAPDPSLECCDLYGNAGGDWVSCVAGQQHVGGNLSLDPVFCDLVSGDLGIDTGSPCAPSNNACGVLIGAHGVACGAVSVESMSWSALKACYR